MANWANISNVGNPLAPGWQDQNLVDVKAPNGQTWRVYKAAAPAFTGLLGDLVAAGYNPVSGGGFNYRTIRGGDKLSQHAFGTAIDISPDTNPMLQGRLKTDLPANIADMAAKYGLEWGGAWQKRPDPMHFEWAGGGAPTMMASAQGAMPNAAPAPTAPANPFAAPDEAAAAPGAQLAMLYMQNAAALRQKQADEAAADQQRRNALFG